MEELLKELKETIDKLEEEITELKKRLQPLERDYNERDNQRMDDQWRGSKW